MRNVRIPEEIMNFPLRKIPCVFSVLLLFAYFVPSVAATNMAAMAAESTNQDMYTLLIGGVLYVAILAVVCVYILRRGKRIKGRSTIVQVMGVSLGILSVAAGSICLISAVIVVLGYFADVTLFAWTWNVLAYLITVTIPAETGVVIPSMTIALLLLGAVGVLVFLLGVTFIVRYGGEEIFAEVATPTRSGTSVQSAQENVRRVSEPQNPVLSYKIDIRRTEEPAADVKEPAADVKVVLRHRNALNVRTKYTDFNGEVSFSDVKGLGSEYYAYVEGDENQEIYRVIRT